jgi:hypothetical protein
MAIREAFDQAMKAWAVESGNLAVTTCRTQFLTGQVLNRRTSNLANRVFYRITPDGKGFAFGTNVRYGIAWELGWSGETIIRPKNAKVLAWRKVIGNRIVRDRKTGALKRGKRIFSDWRFAKMVRLPPQKPRPFLQPTLERCRPEFQKMANERGQFILKGEFPSRRFNL